VVQLFGTPPTTTAQANPVKAPVAANIPTVAPTPASQPVVTITSAVIQPEELAKQPESEAYIGEVAPLSKVALAQNKGESTSPPLFSPFLLTKTIAIFLLGLILGALALDAVFISQRRIVRLSGKNLAHLIFIGALLLSAILTTPGAIL